MNVTFKALLTDVHLNPTKGTVKIQLTPTSPVSLDKLSSLGPKDESIQVVLESAQTTLDASTPTSFNDEIADKLKLAAEEFPISEELAAKLKEAAEKLRTRQPFKSTGEKAGKLKEAAEALSKEEEGGKEEEEVGGGQGGIVIN